MRNRTILVFENSEFESEDRPRHLTLQNVQLHICPTVCIGCLNLSWARHYAFCYCWKAEAVVLRRTQEMEKSLSLGFYCSNYLHYCFLASRSIIHQKIAVTYFWSGYLLWLGILFTVIYVPGDRRSFEIRLRPISVRQSKWSNDSSQSAPSSAKRVRVLHRSLRRISGSQKWEGKMTPSDAFHRSNKVKELESSI